MSEADRRRAALLVRVYGRDPDPAAVDELQALIDAAEPAPVPAQPIERRRPVRMPVLAAMAALALASAAWGTGALAGHPGAASTTAPPRAAAEPAAAGSTVGIEVTDGDVVWFSSGALPTCGTSAPARSDASVCSADGERQQLLVALAQHAAAAARASRAAAGR